ncbi:MAG: SurA N-terminal domain-containing protein [Filomicrobium sp.]
MMAGRTVSRLRIGLFGLVAGLVTFGIGSFGWADQVAAAGPGAGVSAIAADDFQRTLPVVKIRSKRAQGIAVLVNDEPITNYEIEQRQRYLGLSAGGMQDKARAKFKSMIAAKSTTEKLRGILRETIKANPGKSKEQILAIFEKKKKQFAQRLQKRAVASARASIMPGLRKKALNELIEERLKVQEAKRLNVVASEDEINKVVSGIAQRNKMNLKQFAQYMKKAGGDINSMKSRFKAMISWKNVIRRQFGHRVAITSRDLDRMVAQTQGDAETQLNVQRITLLFAKNLGQSELARRLQEASTLRSQFTGCSTTGSLAKKAGGARFSNMGPTKAGRIPEPTRTMLINASDGEMLPPSVGSNGVELWVLCGRNTVEADKTKRDAAKEELRQKEFQVLAARHLNDLRQDAHIEYR